MKKRLDTPMNKYINSLIGAGLIAISTNTIAAPTVSLEAPQENTTITGIIQVFGWTVDEVGIEFVEMRIDGVSQPIRIGSGGERSDVENSYPEVADARYSGYSTALNARLFSNGPHTIEILVTNKNGETSVVSRNIVVSNAPGQQSARDQLDISGATARISGQRIFLDNAILNGRSYSNLELSFDTTTNGYHITAFKEDLDGDGYNDDDRDQDGYHDDDRDRDGFHDDDRDRDGFRDDDRNDDQDRDRDDDRNDDQDRDRNDDRNDDQDRDRDDDRSNDQDRDRDDDRSNDQDRDRDDDRSNDQDRDRDDDRNDDQDRDRDHR